MTHAAKVLTVSNSVSAGEAEDRGGPALEAALERAGFAVVAREVCPDGEENVAGALRGLCAGFSGLVVTTGGSGFAPTDLTPEGTLRVVDRLAPGIAEAMRLADPLGRLSRAVAGVAGTALVLNTPGSPTGAVAFLDAVFDVLPHALDLLAGDRPHPQRGARRSPT